MEWEDVLPAKPVEYILRDGKIENMEEILLHPHSKICPQIHVYVGSVVHSLS